ncbi:RNA polymerase sigma factor [Alkaliphilus peptidifermentans]|uniref:RNA polymerase sigma factor, sigma-70 family n=1 Tax=Alkaliphilus peptidifermentans DSM 18978 TaxID=1120976 RepID=A0A1G5L9Q2_9FIRM|nr:hypothetical protein [Alkaliphilus peptidifermentans]SCZ09181.1 hypothetical protein SAMN03080606_04179 [Alkaliphilus peptidifermentans DSM 18978]
MNRLMVNYLNEEKTGMDVVNKMGTCNVNKEMRRSGFNDYVFKAYLYSYIKKTIVYSALQIKKKHKLLYDTEELSLNVVDPDFSEERVSYVIDNDDSSKEVIAEEVKGDYNYNEISHKKEIIDAIEALTNRQKEIIYRCIIMDESDTYVARKLGISKQGVNKTKIAALEKLKRSLKDNCRDAI